MQEQLENDDVFNKLNARKSGKEDWYRYEPVKVPSPEKQEDKISSLLSKYIKKDGKDEGQNSFAERIKARVLQIQQSRNEEPITYKQAVEMKKHNPQNL